MSLGTAQAAQLQTSPVSAVQIADALGKPRPTDQQCAVIQAPLTPALVVAGAGSGKTETMADRVLWLLANGLVTPDGILGLTFTRKAAGELASRVATRIAHLRTAGLMPDGTDDGTDLFQQPTISTYNAFANTLFRDNALLVGREPEAVLLGESSAWRLARRIVLDHGDARLIPLDKSINRVTEAVLALHHELSENVVDPRRLQLLAQRFGYLADLRYTSGRAKATPYNSVTDAVGKVAALGPLAELAERFSAEKRRQGFVEFSDQVALALTVCEKIPEVVERYRGRYPVVILDEYQDTSVVQTRLLSRLFGGHGVMAVGDPQQSIYGWRGASAANLRRFEQDFGTSTGAAQAHADMFTLSISWRNARTILAAANTLVEPLRTQLSGRGQPLAARPDAPEGRVDTAFAETVHEEAAAVADWFAGQLAEPTAPRSAAILFRFRRHMDVFAHALAQRSIPFHILGLGGLLSTPEIVDVVSALRVVHDPSAGSALIRLLAGARWRLGVRDLKELKRVASWLQSRDSAQHALSDEVRQRMRASVAADDGASIVDALDFLAEAPLTHARLAGFSQQGLTRLRDAGSTMAFFRSRVGIGLLDLVRVIEQELRLDIEVVANESTGQARTAQANLHAFHDEITGFLASDEQATLGSFLGWLDHAARKDLMGPRSDPAEPGTVQLLTIHGAKGLEWDVVAVPRLVADELPAKSREGGGWLAFGVLPYELRGDAAELPELRWRGLDTQQSFDIEVTRFKRELVERHRCEERRLAYVAVTRARDAVLLTGSFWKPEVKAPRPPSTYLTELAAAELIAEMPAASRSEQNPLNEAGQTVQWPLDPLGSRRARVERAARAVRAADPDAGGAWQHEIDLLLAERAAQAAPRHDIALPSRIPASRFKDYVADPQRVAAQLRRPMPERPYRQTRIGTLFHSWIEEQYGARGALDVIDASLDELDDDPGEPMLEQAQLDRLTSTFRGSPWGSRRPEEVELEIQMLLAGRVIVCKLDAVYREPEPGRYQIVDWKTGRVPTDAEDLAGRQLQLALYRLAFSRWKGIDPALIDAVFYFVAEDRVIRPARLYSEEELIGVWSSVANSSPAGSSVTGFSPLE
ncbi:MAG: ATP-dependent DNA helicase [Microbacteriaceae bacterium]